MPALLALAVSQPESVQPKMYISAAQYPAAYQSIVQKSRSRGQHHTNTCNTFLVVSPDVDALCAAHLLANMLKLDDVVNTVIPVASWSELEKLRQRLQNEDVSLDRALKLHNASERVPTLDSTRHTRAISTAWAALSHQSESRAANFSSTTPP